LETDGVRIFTGRMPFLTLYQQYRSTMSLRSNATASGEGTKA